MEKVLTIKKMREILEQIEQVFDYYAQPIQFSVAYAAVVQETE